jgi:ribosomal protein S18 acetylase RimI-like enzyme
MTAIRHITEPHTPDSKFIHEMARVFCSARKERLQFLMDIHGVKEDRRFLSAMVLPANQVWIAEVDRKLAGFIAFDGGWVNHLYIDPMFQRKGFGSRLLDIAKQSSGSLRLWVFEANAPAIRFYESQAFQLIDRTDGSHNEAKMPDVLMEWTEPKLKTDRASPVNKLC